MLHIICLPIGVLVCGLWVVARQFGYSGLEKVCKFVLLIDTLAFAFLFLEYLGYDVIAIVRDNLFK